MDERTVFISFCRESEYTVNLLARDLRTHGWDVLLGETEAPDQRILSEIRARAHFILFVDQGSLSVDRIRFQLGEAVRSGRRILPIIKSGTFMHSELRELPDDLRAAILERELCWMPIFLLTPTFERIRARFLNPLDPIHDPIGRDAAPVPAAVAPRGERSAAMLPAPFAWVHIPAGEVMLPTTRPRYRPAQSVSVADFAMSKYPVTYAQYALFIDAGGYDDPRWWTEAGWEARLGRANPGRADEVAWTAPSSWAERHMLGAAHPVSGVSWYEAVAFCHWLSAVTGEPIMLPTEAQWQYAAQGLDGRAYPWGDEWDWERCVNNVKPYGSTQTCSVRHYEVEGSSPFGVVDMTGNLHEWCLTDAKTDAQDVDGAGIRVKRGGCCFDARQHEFRCDHWRWGLPDIRLPFHGFRLALRLSASV